MNWRGIGAASGLVVLAAAPAPMSHAQPPPGVAETATYPLAQGRYTSPTDFYWVFFRTPDGRSCGIGPNGGPVGCGAVPVDAPEGMNQTVVNSWGPAEYRHSDAATFTRDVDVLPEGHRLENWGAGCAVGHPGTVTCTTYGQHGFILSAVYSEFW
ncbi:hypothetical protein [Mycobacterium sp. NPDC050041]|uniref:hypothetical protein n=1 Tax=Mycobacterium sp. NPDC050041 TaxID=3364293 RepID=UPI003C2B09E0